MDLTLIISVLGGIALLVMSLITGNANRRRKNAEKERDRAKEEADIANEQVEIMASVANVHQEKERKDDEVINRPVDRRRPLGVWGKQDDTDKT